jgi:hypothetical protein
MLDYTVVVWNEPEDEWTTVEPLLARRTSFDVVTTSLTKLHLNEAEILKQYLENRYPDRYFLILSPSPGDKKLSMVD